MKRCSFLLALTFLVIPIFAQKKQGAAADPFAGLDTAFARVLQSWHCAGFAVAVVDKDKVIYAKGFGYKDFEHKVPVTPHTLFAIGSCTKAFTASLIGMLAAKGALDIDKPVRNYLPELKFYNSTMDAHITLRDMMSHRTGLPRHDFAWYLFRGNNRDSMIRKVQYQEPTADIREKWQYNNFMFAAQGVVVEKITGKSWEENMKEKILQPLGMTETDLSINEMTRTPDYSFGYIVAKDVFILRREFYPIDAMGPAGSVNSNVLDMASWVATWINGGKSGGKEIIPANYVREAISSQMIIAAGLPTKENLDVLFSTYGFGWMLADYRSHYRAEHGGNIDGFSASTSFFPSDSIGIVVLTNQNASQVPSVVRNLIADRLLHLPYRDWDSYLKDAAEKAKKEVKAAEATKVVDHSPAPGPSHPLADYTGIYSNPGYGSLEISLTKDSLLAFFPHDTWWLRPGKYDVFQPFEKTPKWGYDTSNTNGVKIQFNLDLTGNISGLSADLEPTLGKPIVFTRSAKTIAVGADVLEKYVGEYAIGTVTIKVYIKAGVLYMSVPGQPDYELANVGPDKFTFKSLNGFSVQFVLDDQGQADAAMLIQPNGTFKATKKK